MKKYGYIYKITVNNDKSVFHGCYYIGQSRYNRKIKPEKYFGSSKYLKNYKLKYGTFGLIKEILCECKDCKELNQKEIDYIGNLYITDAFENGGKCLNLKAGGEGKGVSLNVRKLMSEKMKHNKNFLINGAVWNKGLKYTDEQKKNIVKANKLKPTYGHLGKQHSEKTKKLISKIQKDLIWWTNGIDEKHCKECPGEGWYKGRSIYSHEKMKGRKWWNNGIINLFTKECPGDDFVLGIISKNKEGNIDKC